jgi:hypothetical protein
MVSRGGDCCICARSTDMRALTWPGLIMSSVRTSGCSLRSLPRSAATSLCFFCLHRLHRLLDPPWTFHSRSSFPCFGQEWTSNSSWKDHSLERINGHELGALPHFLRYTGVPVFYLHKNTLTVVVARIADVQRPTWVPEWWTGATADVPCGKLTCYLLDNILDGMVGKMTLRKTLLNFRQERGDYTPVLKTSPSQNCLFEG